MESSWVTLKIFMYLFIFGRTGSSLLCGLFSSDKGGATVRLWCLGLLLQWLLLLWSKESRHLGFSSLSTWTQQLRLSGSRAWVQKLRYTSLVALQCVGLSQIRDQTHVPCIGRQILNHWTTREDWENTFKVQVILLGSFLLGK